MAEIPAEDRVFLLLQGPHGPFFNRLGQLLAQTGAGVWRVAFNAGDAFFWSSKDRLILHDGTPEEWPARLERIIAERMALHGQPVDPAASYRVTVNNFLSVGGDGFTVLTEGTAPLTGIYDIDALNAYFGANSPVGPTAVDRISRIN